MFISTKYLVSKYGIDETIARFFVDREPPVDNLYWHEKLLYLRPAPGYLFIPLIVDLLFKLGIDKEKLFSEKFIGTMERIGHISALEEIKKISAQEAIEQCNDLVEKVSVNTAWLTDVKEYLNGRQGSLLGKLVTPFKSLHRGDVFLLSLSMLEFSSSLFEAIGQQWFALISALLLLDDAEDIESDRETGDENAYLESGLNAKGLHRIAELVQHDVETIASVNPVMAVELERQHTALVEKHTFLHY
ncbi:hypothetical protein [Segetibacter aerophilus]|uniref:Uncharacterized protein n=1 Tax=Segetibacter aerophilus TaxID=670293 RepID=A0A512BEK1_9BACT|nr:hypothetical protein [Segetibacter aerophilus]GEO10403.1 hypothetical protein SAE01_28990 [Segetibacter aerophilus]